MKITGSRYLFGLWVGLLGLLTACSSGDTALVFQAPTYSPAVPYHLCTLASLLHHRARLSGTNVEVTGLFRYEFEQVCLYSRDPACPGAIWLDFNRELAQQARSGLDSLQLCRGKEITVRGRFSLKKGHLNEYDATLEDIVFMSCQ